MITAAVLEQAIKTEIAQRRRGGLCPMEIFLLFVAVAVVGLLLLGTFA